MLSLRALVQEIVLEIPELLAQVNLVSLRILESQALRPESVNLLSAVLLDLLD